MTSQGHPYNRFRRALASRDLAAARAAAADLPRLGLDDALDALLLVRDLDPDRYARGALRWHARFCREERAGLADATALLAGLQGLIGSDPTAADRLVREICARHGLRARGLDNPPRRPPA